MALLDGFSIGEAPAAPASNNAGAPQTTPSGGLLSGFSIGDNAPATPTLDASKVPSANSTLFPKSAAAGPTPPAEQSKGFLQNISDFFSNLVGGFTPAEKAQMTPASLTPKTPAPASTFTANGKTLTIPTYVDPSKLDQSKQPKLQAPVLELNTKLNELNDMQTKMTALKTSNPVQYNKQIPVFNQKLQDYNASVDKYNATYNTPAWQKWQQDKQAGAAVLQEKIDAAKVAPQEYFIRGMTMGYGGDAGLNNKAPAITLSQKGSELAGTVLSYVMLGEILKPIAASIPGAEALSKAAAESPWKIGYPLSILKSLGIGTIGGAIHKADNINERVSNAVQGGATFAAFDAIAYPITSFFRPVFTSLGTTEQTFISKQAESMLPNGANTEQIFSEPKTIYFQNPDDPTLILKITKSTSGGAGVDIVPADQAGVPSNTLPEMTKIQAELFKQEPSVYQKLISFFSDKPEVTIPEGAVKGNIVPEEIKTPEDFVKNPQDYPLYRGETGNNQGFNFTNDKEFAGTFGKVGEPINLPKDAKVISVPTPEPFTSGFPNEALKDNGQVPEFYQKYFDQGYDAVIHPDVGMPDKMQITINPETLKNLEPSFALAKNNLSATLISETKAALEIHPPDFVAKALQDELNVSFSAAQDIIKQVQANRTPAEIQKSIQKSAAKIIPPPPAPAPAAKTITETPKEVVPNQKIKEALIPPKLSQNPQAGFIAPGEIYKSTADAVNHIKDLVNKAQVTGTISGNISKDIYKLEGRDQATTQRLSSLIDVMRTKFTPQERENVYHHMEDNTHPLTDKERTELLPVVKELAKQLTNARTLVGNLGGYITGDIRGEMVPRQANVPENKLTKGFRQLKETGRAFLPGKSPVSKSVGAGSKHRVFHALNYDKGGRVVVSTKGGKVTGFNNKTLTDLGTMKTKTREALMKEDIKPLENKIKRTQKLIDTLESVKNPVSDKKLSTLQTKIEALKEYSKELAESKIGKINTSITNDIVKLNITITKLQDRLNALKPFKSVPKIAEKIEELRVDIQKAIEQEMNLAFSDIYEKVNDIANKENGISEKLIRELKKITVEFKTLSKVAESNFTSTRISNAQSKMIKMINELANIEAQYNPSDLNQRVFTDKEGNRGIITQATTKEITQHTGTEYFKDPIVNYSLALRETLKAANALKFLNSLKESPEYKDIFKTETEERPADYVTTKLPQLRGTYGPPRIMEVFDDLASRQTKGMYLPVYDELNNILTALIVVNPIMHFPNVAMGELASEAATGVVPGLSPSSRFNFAKAIRGVTKFDEDYLKWAENGAPFAKLRDTNQRFTEAVFKNLAKEVAESPVAFNITSKILGYANPVEWVKSFEKMNANVTWTGNDVMLYHALLDYQTKYGETMQEAIDAVTKRMADYRIPSRILESRTISLILQNSNAIFLFMRYHWSGVIKPWIENIKDSFDPRTEAAGGASGRERLQALRTLAFFAVMYLIYQGVDKELQKATGNPNTYISMAGPMRLAQNVEKLREGNTISGFLQSIFGPTPLAKVVGGILLNIDVANFNAPVFGPGGEGVPSLVTNNIANFNAVENVANGNGSWTDFALSLGAGIYSPKNTIQQSTFNGIINVEKPQVEASMKKLIANGDVKGATDLARAFNIRLKESIKETDISNGNSGDAARVQYFFDTFPNGLGQKGYAVRMPSAKTMQNYEANQGKTSGQKTLPGQANKTGKTGAPSDINNHSNPGTINRIVNGVTIYNRMSNEVSMRSQIIKRDGLTGSVTDYQLDHVIALEGGGNNEIDNLQVITKGMDAVNQPVEDFIGQQIAAGKMDAAQAREISIRFKAGLGEKLSSALMGEYYNNYKGQPLKLADIYDYEKNLSSK